MYQFFDYFFLIGPNISRDIQTAESRISLCCMGFSFGQVIDIAKTNTSVICCFGLPHLTSMDWKPGHSMHLPFFNRVHTL